MGAVDFAIISIREDEFEAVLDRVGRETHWERRPDATTELIYNHCTVPGPTPRTVAALRCLEEGSSDAQYMAHELIRQLDPSWILVVGTASGVASGRLSLGDVAISSRIHDFRVEAVLGDGQRSHDIRGGAIDPVVSGVIANLPGMKAKLGPWFELGLDRPATDGDTMGRQPIARAVSIASSDRWVESAELVRVWKQAAMTAEAVDMASAGVYRATHGRKPFVAIRGISAIISVEASPAWTHYACHAAAAFARALIRAWPLESVKPDRPKRSGINPSTPAEPVSERPSGPEPGQPEPGQIEAELAELLVEMFPPDELYWFIRFRISTELANALPAAQHASRTDYAARVVEKLVDRNLLDAKLFDELATERSERAGEIRSLARRLDPIGAGQEPVSTLPTRDDQTSEIKHKLEQAQARKKRLDRAGADTTEVFREIVGLKRALRGGDQLHVGDTLGHDRYLLVSRLGRGGFGTVWKAVDQAHNNTEVAIKVLHNNLAQEPVRRDRFIRGARIMAELDHPGMIRVIEPHVEDQGYHYFVMELAAGGTLRNAVLDRRLTAETGMPLVIGVGRALAAAHKRGYVHRDVKPTNILMAEPGEAKLTDFDLVAAADTTGGTRTGALGTFVYAAPEQLDHPQDVDGRADIYGLAMTAVFVLCGRDLPMTVMRDASGFIGQQECSPGLAQVLARAVNWEPEQRFATMSEFCDALDQAIGGQTAVQASAHSIQVSEPEPGQRQVEQSVEMAFLWLPGDRFTMGSGNDDEFAHDSEKPAREVEVSGLWMAETAVTNAQYEDYVGATGKPPGLWTDDRYNKGEQPVVGVNWYDAVAFCNVLSERAGLDLCYQIDGYQVSWKVGANGYRLPTEAEWEYTCRAGTQTKWSFGDDQSQLGEYAWYGENSDRKLQPVARKKPNPWGLYDMHGNVYEWCWDIYANYPELTAQSVDRNPVGPDKQNVGKGTPRRLRGGSFGDRARFLRSAYRFRFRSEDWDGDIGFRCVRGAARQP